jgi:ribosomal protein S27E
MAWPRTSVQNTCPSCDGLLLAASGNGPVLSFAVRAKGTPPRWAHHRKPPERFDPAAASRLECQACGQTVLFDATR